MRVATIIASLAVSVLLGGAAAPAPAPTPDGAFRGITSPPFYINREARFAIMFPSAPVVKNISYTNTGGAAVPARQFLVEQGINQYSVTVADFSKGPAVDVALVERAVQELARNGEIRFRAADEYEPGVASRQLLISERDGRQLKASVYMWDHRLYVTEARGRPGVSSLLRFEQSVTLLNADGTEVNIGGRPGEAR